MDMLRLMYFVPKKPPILYTVQIYLIKHKPMLFQVQVLIFTEKVKIKPYHWKGIKWL